MEKLSIWEAAEELTKAEYEWVNKVKKIAQAHDIKDVKGYCISACEAMLLNIKEYELFDDVEKTEEIRNDGRRQESSIKEFIEWLLSE